MASPINTFKTITSVLLNSSTTIYTCPPNTTAIILLAQIANITGNVGTVNFQHFDGNVTNTYLINNFAVPAYDAISVLSGKLVVMQNQSVKAWANTSSAFNLTLSIIESI